MRRGSPRRGALTVTTMASDQTQDIYDGMGTIALHLIEQLTQMNQHLQTIAETLEKIENRLGMATALDYEG